MRRWEVSGGINLGIFDRITRFPSPRHRLYDRGCLSVDADLRLRVSAQLRDHGWNGEEFYEREAAGYMIPAPDFGATLSGRAGTSSGKLRA